jgi:hypothetical protein
VVGTATTRDGHSYYKVAADGGVFTFENDLLGNGSDARPVARE